MFGAATANGAAGKLPAWPFTVSVEFPGATGVCPNTAKPQPHAATPATLQARRFQCRLLNK
jgi:hypothetical protein